VVATILLILQFIRFRRERARLKVWTGVSVGLGGSELVLHVVNPPLSPAITIMQAGLMSKEDDVLSLVEEPDGSAPKEDVEIKVRHSLLFHHDEPVLISEGETKIFKVKLDSMPPPLPEDGREEFRSFALDAEGRLVRGNKGEFFRDALEAGWKPKDRKSGDAFGSTVVVAIPDSRLKRWWWRWNHR